MIPRWIYQLIYRMFLWILVLIIGVKAYRNESYGNHLGVFSFYEHQWFYLLVILLLIAMVLDFRGYYEEKRIYHFLPTATVLIFCLVIGYKFYQNEKIESLKTVLKVSNLPGAENVMTFEFKESGYYKLVVTDLLGSTTYYGKYSKKDDTLEIESTNYTNELKKLPKRGVIKRDTVYWYLFDSMLLDRR
jgi:hypothetical protein